MKKELFVLLSALFISSVLFSQKTFKVDPYHSSVNFKIKHLGINFVTGKFEKFDGTIYGSDFKTAKVEFTVDTKSINTSVPPRDKHLQTAEFFDVEKYPQMKFSSTSFEKSGEKYKLTGNLTIKDVTRPVTFIVEQGGEAVEDGLVTYGFSAKTTINRFNYNISYDPKLTTVGKDVTIMLYLAFKEQK